MTRGPITPQETYAEQLEHLDKGTALFYPGPYRGADGAATNIELADVGYIDQGRFYKLFNATDPPKELKDEKGHLPYARQFVDDYNKTSHNDDKFISQTVQIHSLGASAGVGIPTAADASLSFRIECHQNSGAALLLPSTINKGLTHYRLNHRGGVDGYIEYFYNHCNDWLEYAQGLAARDLELKDLLFVTDVHRASKWLLYCFTSKASAYFVGAASQALNGSLQFGISGSQLAQTDHGVHRNEADDRLDAESTYDQSVFIESFRMHKRPNSWAPRAISKPFSGSSSNSRKSGSYYDSSARGRTSSLRQGFTSLGGSRSIGGSTGNNPRMSGSETPSRSQESGTQADQYTSAMLQHVQHLSLRDYHDLDLGAVSDDATRDSPDVSEHESNLLDEELLDPHSALLEYILEACPNAQYSCASDDDLKQFKEYLSDWAAFPGILRQVKPKFTLNANGLASLADCEDSHLVSITNSVQSDLEDASDTPSSIPRSEGLFPRSPETYTPDARPYDDVNRPTHGSGNRPYPLPTTSSDMKKDNAVVGPTDSKHLGPLGPLSRAPGGEYVTRLAPRIARDDVEATLKLAAENGNEAVVRQVLVRDDVDVNSRDDGGRTPLSLAAERGHEGVVSQLLARDDVDVNSKDNSGRTPLSLAAQRGQWGVVSRLLARGDVDVNSKDNRHRTPLFLAAEKRREAVVSLLLARDDVDANSKDDSGRTPLYFAAERGNEAVVRLLLARDDVDVNAKDDNGRIPLAFVPVSRHSLVARLLRQGTVNRENRSIRNHHFLHQIEEDTPESRYI